MKTVCIYNILIGRVFTLPIILGGRGMIRIKKIVILILTMVILICNSSILVFAEDTEYKSFSQIDNRWSSYVYDGGCTLGKSGCAITSLTILMAYANPDLRNADDWNPKIASQKFTFDGKGALYWGTTKEADPTFTQYAGTKVYNGKALEVDKAKEKVKEYLDMGLYLVICVKGMYSDGTHYSPIVGWDTEKDEPMVWDVAGGVHSNWSDWANQGITEILAYRSSLNSSDKTLCKSSDDALSAEPSSSEKKEILKVIKENELVGMPSDFSIGTDVMLPEENSLSEEEKISMESIKSNIKSNDDNWVDYARVGVSFAGLCLIIYGVLLGVAYLFDRTNNIVDISLLAILTLGKYVVWDEDYGVNKGYNASDKKMYCGNSEIIKRIVVVEVAGFLLVGGHVFRLISRIFEYVSSFF